MLGSWPSGSKQVWIRPFKLGTIRLSMIIYSKAIGCQSLRPIIIWIAWSLSAEILMLEWGLGSISSLSKLWRLVTLQSFNLQGFIVSHLKDLIHICLEPEDQDSSMTLRITYTLSKNPYFTSWGGKKTSFFVRHCNFQFRKVEKGEL